MIEKQLKQLRLKHILVIGDVMLDVFSSGSVNRISPEAPVQILDIKNDTDCLGGALNVCNNIVSLGAGSEIIGVVGDDFEAFRLDYLCERHKIKKIGLLRDSKRVTTSKTRLFDGDKPLLRVDREQRDTISIALENKLIAEMLRAMASCDAIILQDYNKGVLTPRLIRQTLEHANTVGVPVFVDPKLNNIESYAGAFLVKPNRPESEAILGYSITSIEDAKKAASDLLEKIQCENILLTLGSKGMILRNKEELIHIPGHVLDVADITGAGDTVIAVITALHSTGLPLATCAEYANRAAAKVCGHSGVVPVISEMLK